MGGNPDLRNKIAREAAVLLYFGAEKEYKPAKDKAAKTWRVNSVPTNLEVALELEKIADENEGTARIKRLIQMRKEAYRIMKLLEPYHPVLIGSVWRGTIRQGSDIDVQIYHDDPDKILDLIRKTFRVFKAEWVTVTKKGKPIISYHINGEAPIGEKVEIVVRSSEEEGQERKCEVFGDILRGLTLGELGHLLGENPVKKFLPSQ